jgi:hypothetical protein
MGGLQAGEAVVAIPRFEVKLEPSLSLVESLRQMGVVHAFDPALADFSGMAAPLPNVGPLVVGNILHQAFLRVDESGTEAAAATAVAMGTALAPRRPVPVFRPMSPSSSRCATGSRDHPLPGSRHRPELRLGPSGSLSVRRAGSSPRARRRGPPTRRRGHPRRPPREAAEWCIPRRRRGPTRSCTSLTTSCMVKLCEGWSG